MKSIPRPKVRMSIELPPTPSASTVSEQMARYIRDQPMKAMGQAATAGYLLRLVPVRTLLSIGMRLAWPVAAFAALRNIFQSRPAPRQRARR